MKKDKFISRQGYKKDSPDRNNPYNVIPSGRITMQDVPFPVYGIDNLGNEQMMHPGQEYDFPGNEVTEIPMHQMQVGGQAYNDSLSVHKWGESNYKRFQEKPSMEDWTSGGFQMPYNIFEAFNRLEDLNNESYDPSETIHETLRFKDGRPGEAGVNRYPKPVGNERPYKKPLKHIPSKGLINNYDTPTIDSTKREGIPTPPTPTIIGYTQKWDSENNKWIQEPVLQVVPEPSYKTNKLQEGGEYLELELTDEEIAQYRAKGYQVDEL